MTGIVFLAAHTPRSQTYAQIMACNNIKPDITLLFGNQHGDQPGQSSHELPATYMDGLFVPDYSESLTDTCARNKWLFESFNTNDVNDSGLVKRIREIRPQMIIYGGYGGQIVCNDLLDIGTPFLHTHAGWLPDYRGSTTIYYSLLKEGRCAVSAFILGRSIDTGPVIARKYYKPPPTGTNIDYVYDSVIRADLMLSVIKDWQKNGEFSVVYQQVPNEGETYYVIHPLLKHIAILSMEHHKANQ